MASPQHLGVALALGLLLPRDEDDMDDDDDRAPRPRVIIGRFVGKRHGNRPAGSETPCLQYRGGT